MMDVVDKLCTCALCHGRFTSPRKLPCCHSFCHGCIASYLSDFRGKTSFPCPTCAYDVQAPIAVSEESGKNLPGAEFERALLLLEKTGSNGTGSDVMVKCSCGGQSVISKFCTSCNIPVCDNCGEENHTACETSLLRDKVQALCAHQRLKCSQALYTAKQELTNAHETLLPKERQLLMKKEETALGISKYFSELRLKVTKYLLDQEQKVQDDLENLVLLEKNHLKDDVRKFSAMLDSVEKKQSLIMGSINKTEESQFSIAHLKLLSSFQTEVERYESSAKEMESETPDARFIINTELEDALSSTDLIKIEVTNTRQYDRRQDATCQDSSNESSISDSSESISTSEADSTNETQDVESSTDSANITGQGRNSTISSRLSTSSANTEVDPNEPPPPYPGRPQSEAANVVVNISVENPPGDKNSSVETESNKNSKNVARFQQFRPIPSAPPASLADEVISHLITESSEERLRPPEPEGRSRSQSPRFERGNTGNTLRSSGRRDNIPSPQPMRRHPQSSHREGSRRHRDSASFSLKNVWQANTMAVGEHKPPRIFGMSWLQDEYLLVADRWNHRLKVLKNGMIVHVYSLGQYQPWDIAEMPNNYSAVAVPEGKMIYIVLYEVPDIKIRKKIATKRGYSCLAYDAEHRQFFGATISQFSPPGVDIIGTDGQQLATIVPSNSGRGFLSYPRGISVFGNKVVVTDFQKKTVIFIRLEERANISAKYQGTETMPLREPNGITVNTQGRYFLIFDTRSGKIHVVSVSGHAIGVVNSTLDYDEPCKAAIDTSVEPPRLAVAFGNGIVVTYELLCHR